MTTEQVPGYKFTNAIKAFNRLYSLPVNDVPVIPFATLPDPAGTVRKQLTKRLQDLRVILLDEVSEVDEILNKVAAGDPPADVLVAIADWLGDLQIYCASEMVKFGLDNDVVLSTIMASNMSKLGTDGQPIKDATGKVLKGPNFWPPEPQLLRYIATAQRIQTTADGVSASAG